MVDFIEFPDVVQELRGALYPGKLKMQPGAVTYKNNKTSKTFTFSASTIEKTEWLQRSKGFCLKIVLADGTIHRIDGFKESEYDKLQSFMQKNYGLSCPKVDLNVKGWNWGKANFIGDTLSFDNHDKCIFEIPLTNVSNSVVGKNEVTLEFHQNDDAAVSLCEMRFHIPSGNLTNVNVEDDENREPIDLVQEFHQNVLEKADIMRALGDSIAVFQEIQCLTPRGRYDIKVFPTFIQLHGRSFDFKIPYSTILRLFLLPHRDGRQMYFVMSLDPPMKQGQTRYPFLILLFNMEDETTIELGLEEEELEEKYKDKLQKEMSGTEYEVISQIITAITNRKITTPVNFKSNDGSHAIQVSCKAQTGSLYPLEKGFIFIPKPAIHIRFEEISQINFARSSGSTRSFDFDIETKTNTTFNFVGVEKNEYGKLYDFVSSKNLRVKNIGGIPGKRGFTSNYREDGGSSGDETNHDAYLERMKHEGKDRDDDEDSSEDEDFNPDLEEGVDVREEYDSNPETTSESEAEDSNESGNEEEKAAKRKAKKELKDIEKEKKREAREKRKERKDKPPTEKRTKKSKKDRDPNMPKRPQTAYFLWMNENREAIKAENPEGTIVDISRAAGEKWRGMTAEEKVPYEEQVKEAKIIYEEAMIEYRKTAPVFTPTKKEKSSNSAAKNTATKKRSPQKPVGGAGSSYKSAEFIEDSDSDSDKEGKKGEKKTKSKKKEKKVKKEEEEEMEEEKDDEEEEEKDDEEEEEKDDDKDDKKDDKKKEDEKEDEEENKSGSDVGELPSEEEILSDPPVSSDGSDAESD